MGVKGFQKGHIVSEEIKAKISKANDGNFFAICDYCGKKYHTRKSAFEKRKRHFCCKECYTKYQTEMLPKEEHNRYGKGYTQEERNKRKEAREKQVAKKPIVKAEKEVPTTHNLGRLLEICCPVCGKRIFAIYETDLKRGGGVTREAKGCSRCLQAIDFTGYYYTPKLDKSDEDIDWSEEDD